MNEHKNKDSKLLTIMIEIKEEKKTVILYTKGRVGYLAVSPFRRNRLCDSRNHSGNLMYDLLYIRPYMVKYDQI